MFLDVLDRIPSLVDLGVHAIQPPPIVEFATERSLGDNGTDYFTPEGTDPGDGLPGRPRGAGTPTSPPPTDCSRSADTRPRRARIVTRPLEPAEGAHQHLSCLRSRADPARRLQPRRWRLRRRESVLLRSRRGPRQPLLHRPRVGGAGFDVVWSSRSREAIRGVVGQAVAGRDATVNLDPVRDALGSLPGFTAARAVQHFENHDVVYAGHVDREPRIASLRDATNARSWYARRRARVALGLPRTAPGIPLVFMGQEFSRTSRGATRRTPPRSSSGEDSSPTRPCRTTSGSRRTSSGYGAPILPCAANLSRTTIV